MPVAPHAAVIPGKYYHTGKCDLGSGLDLSRKTDSSDGAGSLLRSNQSAELQRCGHPRHQSRQEPRRGGRVIPAVERDGQAELGSL